MREKLDELGFSKRSAKGLKPLNGTIKDIEKMKAFKIIEEAYEKEVIGKNFSRRDALTKGLGFGLKAAIAMTTELIFESPSGHPQVS